MGGKKVGKNPIDCGKLGTKRSLLTDGGGVPIGLAVEGANRHDCKLARATLASLPIARPVPTADQPQGLCLDKAYDYDEVRALLTEFGCTVHIRARGKEAQAPKQEAGYRAQRWVVERTHSWMNRFRRVLIRWDKKSRITWRFCIWHVPILRIDNLAYLDRLLVFARSDLHELFSRRSPYGS